MPRTKAAPKAGGRRGRYTYIEVSLEIARALDRRGRGSAKELAAHLHLTEQQFSHRMRGKYARFDIETLGVMADWFNAPPDSGWPFVRWR